MTTATQPPPAGTSHLPTLAAVLPLLEGVTTHKPALFVHLGYIDPDVQRATFRELRDRFPESALSLDRGIPADLILKVETIEATVQVRFNGAVVGETRECTHVTTCYVVDGVEIA